LGQTINALQVANFSKVGVVLAGPSPRSLIDPVTPNELRQAVLGILWWWERQLEDNSLLQESAYQVYAILSMCRVLYTIQHGTIVSKPVAARWAREVLPERWILLIDLASVWQPDAPMDHLPETLAFIRYTLSHSQENNLN
jgi:hypothetical protein